MKEQKLVVFDGYSPDVNKSVDQYIEGGWRVVKFESRVQGYENHDGYDDYNVILTVLFER